MGRANKSPDLVHPLRNRFSRKVHVRAPVRADAFSVRLEKLAELGKLPELPGHDQVVDPVLILNLTGRDNTDPGLV